jgi:hypothetical protein
MMDGGRTTAAEPGIVSPGLTPSEKGVGQCKDSVSQQALSAFIRTLLA